MTNETHILPEASGLVVGNSVGDTCHYREEGSINSGSEIAVYSDAAHVWIDYGDGWSSAQIRISPKQAKAVALALIEAANLLEP
jgi:hypothetical protein